MIKITKKIKWITSFFCLFPLASLSMISCVQKNETPVESSKINDSTNASKDSKKVDSTVAYEQLLTKVNSVLKVKFDSDEDKLKTVEKVKFFFDRIASGARSNGNLSIQSYIELLKRKISTSLIQNNNDTSDKFNYPNIDDLTYLNVDDLTKKIDYNLDKFNFSDSFKASIIDSIYRPHLEFFKRSVYVKTSLSFDPGPEGIVVWSKRVFWPSLQYGIAYKLNGIDQKSISSSGSLNTDFNFEQRIFVKKNLIIDKIIYITNQILISIFNHYKLFLNSLDSSEIKKKNSELTKIFILLQTLFYGKNAEEIFKQFLKNNENYNVKNFISDLNRKNFGNNEPDYLKNVIDSKNKEKSYENLLMYLNYLNFNYDKSIVKDGYAQSKYGQDPAFSGAFTWSDIKDKNWYKNKTIFSVIKRNEQKQIIDVDFNEFFI